MFSIIIPVLNEEESIHELVKQIYKNVSSLNKPFEIIFINDGSTDNTQQILEQLSLQHEEIHFIKFRKNFGKSAALNAGFHYAKYDTIFTMDADLQDDPQEIPRFLKEIENGYDLVTGWKKNRLDPKEKTIPSKVFNFITSKFSGLKLHDYNCGFKCYKKNVLEEINIYGEMHRFVPFLAFKRGFKIKEIPIKHRERKYGSSKFGWERYARGFFDLLTVIFITNYNARPMHLFGKVGSFFLGLGFLFFLYLFFGRWLQGISIGTSPLFTISMSFIGIGVQIFLAGLIAEMLVHHRHKEEENFYSIEQNSFENN